MFFEDAQCMIDAIYWAFSEEVIFIKEMTGKYEEADWSHAVLYRY